MFSLLAGAKVHANMELGGMVARITARASMVLRAFQHLEYAFVLQVSPSEILMEFSQTFKAFN